MENKGFFVVLLVFVAGTFFFLYQASVRQFQLEETQIANMQAQQSSPGGILGSVLGLFGL